MWYESIEIEGMKQVRIDVRMVELGLVGSRSKAQALIKSGAVSLNGKVVNKTGLIVEEDDEVEVRESELLRYVSRGGLKLEKAIKEFGISFDGKRVLDVGSSTGGFTDCALRHGATAVVAVDVGRDVMDAGLAADSRVELHENTDIREYPAEELKDIDIVTCDVSFISLLKVAEAISRVPGKFELVALIKPQFECGLEVARRYKGVIKDAAEHKKVLRKVVLGLLEVGFFLRKVTYSPIKGGDGNIEYIGLFGREHTDEIEKLDELVDEAFGREYS